MQDPRTPIERLLARVWEPGLSPFWWAVAALLGSHLAKAIHNAHGWGAFTGDQRAVLGVAVMAGFLLFVGVASTVRNRVGG